LFIGEPKTINEPDDPQPVASAGEAERIVGYPVYEPSELSCTPITTTMEVMDRTTVEFQINVETAQQMLELMDIQDITLPAALGDKPITIDMPSSVAMAYECDGMGYRLVQGRSPSVSMPDGVDLVQPGKAWLRLLGVAPDQADVLSKQIDWGSTLVFPFPADLGSIRQVTINGAEALLTSGSNSRHHHKSDGESYKEVQSLYWQQGENFYVLMAEGVGHEEMIIAAESVR
jgi:hypothetical protein